MTGGTTAAASIACVFVAPFEAASSVYLPAAAASGAKPSESGLATIGRLHRRLDRQRETERAAGGIDRCPRDLDRRAAAECLQRPHGRGRRASPCRVTRARRGDRRERSVTAALLTLVNAVVVTGTPVITAVTWPAEVTTRS